MEKMNDWAEKIMSVFPDRNRSADLDRFITEVNNDQAEQMYYQKELDAASETTPTFEQLSLERIISEVQKDIMSLKALESIVSERLLAFSAYHSSIIKVRSSFEAFEGVSGTLRLAFDSLYLFSEQEIAQSKQQIFLGDLKKSLSEMRSDANKRIADYQREIAQAEKEVASAENKLARTKEQAEKGSSGLRKKIENLDLDSIFNAAKNIGKDRSDRNRELSDDSPHSKGDTVKEDIRNLLRCISYRDQVLKASRRALQKLNRECKKAMFYTLRKIVDKEREHVDLRKLVVDKFETNVKAVDVLVDMNDFVVSHMGEGGELVYSAQALSLLTDLFQPLPGSSVEADGSSLTPRSRQPSMASPSPLRTPQSSPPAVSARKSLAAVSPPSSEAIPRPSLATTVPVAPTPAVYEFNSYLSQIFYTQQVEAAPHVLVKEDSFRLSDTATTCEAVSAHPSASPPPPPPRQATTTATALTSTESVSATTSSPSSSSSSSSSALVVQSTRKEVVRSSAGHGVGEDGDDVKAAHRKARVTNMDIKYRDIEHATTEKLVELESNASLKLATQWLCESVRTLAGREIFISELNQFRSKKVNLGSGFDALGVVLWTALSYCQLENDIRTAKVIMMLAQTFYKKIEDHERPLSMDGTTHVRERQNSEDEDGEDEDVQQVGKRGTRYRKFLKDKLMGHTIWQDGNFWEQTLWQCALEQLQTIPYEKAWHDMDKDARNESVRRVHEVLFSQVMAVTHSMMELGCSKQQCREFLYRMSVIHELSESQRMQLLAHVLRR